MVIMSIWLLAAVIQLGAPNDILAKSKVAKKSVSIQVGAKKTLKVKGKNKKYKWSSANKKVASVSKKGIVRAKKEGKTVVTAKNDKRKYRFKITVIPKDVIVNQSDNDILQKNGVSYEDMLPYVNVTTTAVPEGVIFTVSNDNSSNNVDYPKEIVYLNICATFYDATGNKIEQSKLAFNAIANGNKVSILCRIKPDVLKNIDLSKTLIEKIIEQDNAYTYYDRTKNIKLTHNQDTNGKYVDYSVEYVCTESWEQIFGQHKSGQNVYCLITFYDAAGNIIKTDDREFTDVGTTAQTGTFEKPDNCATYRMDYYACCKSGLSYPTN